MQAVRDFLGVGGQDQNAQNPTPGANAGRENVQDVGVVHPHVQTNLKTNVQEGEAATAQARPNIDVAVAPRVVKHDAMAETTATIRPDVQPEVRAEGAQTMVRPEIHAGVTPEVSEAYAAPTVRPGVNAQVQPEVHGARKDVNVAARVTPEIEAHVRDVEAAPVVRPEIRPNVHVAGENVSAAPRVHATVEPEVRTRVHHKVIQPEVYGRVEPVIETPETEHVHLKPKAYVDINPVTNVRHEAAEVVDGGVSRNQVNVGVNTATEQHHGRVMGHEHVIAEHGPRI